MLGSSELGPCFDRINTIRMTTNLCSALNAVPSLQPKLYFNLAHRFGKSKLQRMHVLCHCIVKEPSLFVYLELPPSIYGTTLLLWETNACVMAFYSLCTVRTRNSTTVWKLHFCSHWPHQKNKCSAFHTCVAACCQQVSASIELCSQFSRQSSFFASFCFLQSYPL